MAHMRQVSPDTLYNYVAAIRSRHVDSGRAIDTFESPTIKRLLAGAASLFATVKREKMPISRQTLEKVVTNVNTKCDANIDAAFTLAWSGMLRMGEITYPATAVKTRGDDFARHHVTRSAIKVSANLDSMTLTLPRSKTDKSHQGVKIFIAATGDSVCPVAAMVRLLNRDEQPDNAPLFNLNGEAFTTAAAKRLLSARLLAAGVPPNGYTNHSFRRGSAQHAKDCGFHDSQIQLLGRWTSSAFKAYVKVSPEERLLLNERFQRGNPVPLRRRP